MAVRNTQDTQPPGLAAGWGAKEEEKGRDDMQLSDLAAEQGAKEENQSGE